MQSTFVKYNNLKARLLKRCGNKCRECGSVKNLEFHHVQGHPKKTENGVRGGYQSLLHIQRLLNENEGLVALLCSKCHKKVGA